MGTDCYIARKSCGCVVAWVSDEIRKKDLAKIIGDWIREGLVVERADTEWARTNMKRCKCER